MCFSEYLDKQDIIIFQESDLEQTDAINQINWNSVIGSFIGRTFGLAFSGLVLVWIISLLVKIFTSGVSKSLDNFKKSAKNLGFTEEQIETINKNILEKQKTSKVQSTIMKIGVEEEEYLEELKEVYKEIEKRNYEKAHQEYLKLNKNLRNLPEINRTIVSFTSTKIGKLAVSLPSPGNETFQAIRKILSLKEAKAAALMTELTMKKLASQN